MRDRSLLWVAGDFLLARLVSPPVGTASTKDSSVPSKCTLLKNYHNSSEITRVYGGVFSWRDLAHIIVSSEFTESLVGAPTTLCLYLIFS